MQDTHTEARKVIILREGRYSSLDMQDTTSSTDKKDIHKPTRHSFTDKQSTHSDKQAIHSDKQAIHSQTSKKLSSYNTDTHPEKKRHLFTIKQRSYIFPCGYCSAWASAEKYSKTERVTQDTHLSSSKRPSQQQHQKSQPPDYSGTNGQHTTYRFSYVENQAELMAEGLQRWIFSMNAHCLCWEECPRRTELQDNNNNKL